MTAREPIDADLADTLLEWAGLDPEIEPGKAWLAAGMLLGLTDHLDEDREPTYSVYLLGEDGDEACFYAGFTRDVSMRFRRHLKTARSPAYRAKLPVAARIHESMDHGGVWCAVYAAGLTEADSRAAELRLIGMLVDVGHPLVNKVVGRPLNPAEKNRRYYCIEHGHARTLACSALKDLRRGGAMTPRREVVLRAAGRDYWSRAEAILAARQRGGPMV